MSTLLVLLVIVVVLVFVTFFAGVKAVPQGFNWTVERFGRFHALLQPGLNFIVPFIDSIGRKISVMEKPIQIPAQRVITKDNASVEVDGIVFYTVLDAVRASYAVSNLETSISVLAMTNIRTAIGSMDLDETLSNRERINSERLRVLDLATEVWGTKVTRVELKDVQPPADVVASMAKQLAADREARANILQADGIKKAAIFRRRRARSSRSSWPPKAASPPRRRTPPRAKGWLPPRPRRPAWCPKRSRAAVRPPSTTSSRRNTPTRWPELVRHPTPSWS